MYMVHSYIDDYSTCGTDTLVECAQCTDTTAWQTVDEWDYSELAINFA